MDLISMVNKKIEHPAVKPKIHPRSKHLGRYDFKQLIERNPDLAPFVRKNAYNDLSIDFSNPDAVKMLNKALLIYYYNLTDWDIPAHYLCPPIPGRADYIHHIADLLATYNQGKIPTGQSIHCLDVGVGASCIYPIIGINEYGWTFTGTETDPIALQSADKIIRSNAVLKGKIDLRLQTDPMDIFRGITLPDEHFDLTICNPPFHASAAEAQAGTLRKLSNLSQQRITKPTLNFGGKNSELWCEGGEIRFVRTMIRQSRKFVSSCFLFSTLISKESNLRAVYGALKQAEAIEVHTIEMGQGNKTSRIVVWTFLTPKQQNGWMETRWMKK